MSYVSIYRIEPNGDMTHIGDAGNAWGFCFAVWEGLAVKYDVFDVSGYWLRDQEGVQRLWNMADGTELSYDENLVLQATFDKKLLRLEDARNLPDVLEAFYAVHCERKNLVRTMTQMAEIIREGLQGRPDALGIGIEANSISCDWYRVYDPETDEDRPYNVNTDAGHEWAEFERKAP